MANNIRVIDKQVRGIVNIVFYVEHMEKQTKDGVWHDAGWVVRVKHGSRDPFNFDHCPTNDELKKLWRWH